MEGPEERKRNKVISGLNPTSIQSHKQPLQEDMISGKRDHRSTMSGTFRPGKIDYSTTVACDTGLGVTLWQKEGEVFRPIAFASRFLTNCEKNAINGLELQGALWAIDHFRYYVYGKRVNFLTDHQVPQPLRKRNRARKHDSARLTRWLDRLSHFDVNVHTPPVKTFR